VRQLDKAGVRFPDLASFIDEARDALAADNGDAIVSALLYPACHLFTECLTPIEIDERAIDALLRASGYSLPLCLRAVRALDAQKVKIYSAEELVAKVSEEMKIMREKRREVKQRRREKKRQKKLAAAAAAAKSPHAAPLSPSSAASIQDVTSVDAAGSNSRPGSFAGGQLNSGSVESNGTSGGTYMMIALQRPGSRADHVIAVASIPAPTPSVTREAK
jgi:hypothetical protein